VVTNTCSIGSPTSFHTYTAQWTHSTITVLIDGRQCLFDRLKPSGTSPFDQPFFMMLSQALGSTRPNMFNPLTTPLPATTLVDWVRAWK
jgi:beta-glucanase (GH16 family)